MVINTLIIHCSDEIAKLVHSTLENQSLGLNAEDNLDNALLGTKEDSITPKTRQEIKLLLCMILLCTSACQHVHMSPIKTI